MAVKRRGKSWQADVTIRGRRVRATAASEQAARVLEAEIRASLLAGRPPSIEPQRESRASIGGIMEKVYERQWRGTRGEKTAWINARSAVEFFGSEFSVRDIVIDMIDDYVDHLQSIGNSNGTINRKLAALSTLLGYAEDRGFIRKKPKISRKPEPVGRIRYFSCEEEAALVSTLRGWGRVDVADLVEVLFDTGLRLGEALRLEWRDVEFEDKALRIWDTKNGESRSIPMTRRIVGVLKGRVRGEKPFSISAGSVRYQWDRMREHLGFGDDPQFVIHAVCRQNI